ncbi:MAG: elongation factor P, partial [SAR324 cluster bacterium]
MQPHLVVDKEFFNPGKGAAVVRLKLKNLKTGNVVAEVLKTDELVEQI